MTEQRFTLKTKTAVGFIILVAFAIALLVLCCKTPAQGNVIDTHEPDVTTTASSEIVYASTTVPPATIAARTQKASAKPTSSAKNNPVTAVVSADVSATTTPGMPPEPIEQQKNIPPAPTAEADPDANEHMTYGEDYDLPTTTIDFVETAP